MLGNCFCCRLHFRPLYENLFFNYFFTKKFGFWLNLAGRCGQSHMNQLDFLSSKKFKISRNSQYILRSELPELDTCFDTMQCLQLDTCTKASVDTDTSDMAPCVILLIRYAFQSDALILDLFVLISV